LSDINCRVAVLVSGNGTNLQALIDHHAAGRLAGEICGVLSDRRAARGLERARTAGIPASSVFVRPTRAPGYDKAMLDALGALQPDLVVLAGYMRILSPDCVRAFSDRMLNLHPSLLPRHKGTDTHRRVLEAGDAQHGASVHFVTPKLDDGPSVVQYRLTVGPADTEDSLSARVHKGEHIILPMAVQWFCEGRLRSKEGTVMLDGKPIDAPVIIEEQPEEQPKEEA
jgi:phosphoribosylglycinamide formyltransferase-1